MIRTFVAALLVLVITTPALAQNTAPGTGPWQAFAASLPIGATVKVRLTDGRRFSAVVVQVQPGALLLQPKTRQPVPVQPLPYAAIASMEQVTPGGGMSAGKAIAIGAAAGAGAFLAILLAMVSAID